MEKKFDDDAYYNDYGVYQLNFSPKYFTERLPFNLLV